MDSFLQESGSHHGSMNLSTCREQPLVGNAGHGRKKLEALLTRSFSDWAYAVAASPCQPGMKSRPSQRRCRH